MDQDILSPLLTFLLTSEMVFFCFFCFFSLVLHIEHLCLLALIEALLAVCNLLHDAD